MDSDIDAASRENLARVLESDIAPQDFDPDLDLADSYGLTSLNRVLFLMSVCDDTGVSLTTFTEPDVAALRTLRDVNTALAERASTAA
jgi:acyl carrier protein